MGCGFRQQSSAEGSSSATGASSGQHNPGSLLLLMPLGRAEQQIFYKLAGLIVNEQKVGKLVLLYSNW